jgi:hypothetical protein
VLIFLVSLLGLILVVLAIPVDLNFSLSRTDSLEGNATLGWLFGLVQIPLNSGDENTKPAAPAAPKKPRSKRGRSRLHVGAKLRSQGFISRVFHLLRRLKACIHIRQLRLQLLLGLDDPADTGQLWGMLGPLAMAVPVPAGANVSIQPKFNGAAFQVDGEGAIRILPIEILGTLLIFVLSPVTLRAFYALGTGR